MDQFYESVFYDDKRVVNIACGIEIVVDLGPCRSVVCVIGKKTTSPG